MLGYLIFWIVSRIIIFILISKKFYISRNTELPSVVCFLSIPIVGEMVVILEVLFFTYDILIPRIMMRVGGVCNNLTRKK